MKREQTFAEREAEFNKAWDRRIAECNKWHLIQQSTPSTAVASTITDTSAPTAPKTSVVRIGDKQERTEEKKATRNDQALAVLKAMLEKPEGYTDAELVGKRIGGTDGPRRRRYLRQHFEIDFTVGKENDISRWSLTDVDHAKRVLAAGKPVEKYL